MDISLSSSARDWQQRIARFADEELIPWEEHAEMHGGELPADTAERHRRIACDELGLSRMDAPASHGGLGLSMEEQVAIWEQLGRVTNALCWCFPEAQHWMFEACKPAQLERYVAGLMDGSRQDAYAITEAESGSMETVNSTAASAAGGYLLNGEKWFVTSGNLADFLWVQAKTDSGRDSLFLVDKDCEGIEVVDNPLFSHSFASHHPTYQFKDVFVPAENRVGEEDAGMDYTRSWFRHERLMIAARCCGAALRLLELGTEWAKQRRIDHEMLADKQAIQFMLADCASELWSARLVLYEAARAHDGDADLKSLHTRCAIAKLQCSEMANRVCDRVLQILGGRGYMRRHPAERFFRELRVDRIWEGSSEVQRMVIARGLLKRGFIAM
ncbi:MAG: acyl-CoA dehydrogenase family protein [Halieaceae bacterium]|jgi:alkylation response protein AidB-like acyl-CoA dehydrogenase|nr:acyl-CoA dehydrogenase family protein [Halieaceae bacterium]